MKLHVYQFIRNVSKQTKLCIPCVHKNTYKVNRSIFFLNLKREDHSLKLSVLKCAHNINCRHLSDKRLQMMFIY